MVAMAEFLILQSNKIRRENPYILFLKGISQKDINKIINEYNNT
jgi:hypothetical protein